VPARALGARRGERLRDRADLETARGTSTSRSAARRARRGDAGRGTRGREPPGAAAPRPAPPADPAGGGRGKRPLARRGLAGCWCSRAERRREDGGDEGGGARRAASLRAGLFVRAEPGARVDLFDEVLATSATKQDLREHLSTFSARWRTSPGSCARRRSARSCARTRSGSGRPGRGRGARPGGARGARHGRRARVATTHYGLLKEMAEVDPRFANASVELDPDTLAPPPVAHGAPGRLLGHRGGGAHWACRARAPRAPTRSCDRRRPTARWAPCSRSLSASRAALESEQREASRLRAESEAVRARVPRRASGCARAATSSTTRCARARPRLRSRPHDAVAVVIRDLQRGGTARDAARARDA